MYCPRQATSSLSTVAVNLAAGELWWTRLSRPKKQKNKKYTSNIFIVNLCSHVGNCEAVIHIEHSAKYLLFDPDKQSMVSCNPMIDVIVGDYKNQNIDVIRDVLPVPFPTG